MICFVCSNLWPYSYGGSERRYYEFALELMRRGYEVRYVTYGWGPSVIPVVSVGPPPRLYDRGGRRRFLPALLFALEARRAVARAGCRVVDASVPYTEVHLFPREKTILTLHEFWGPRWRRYFGPLRGRLVEWAERRLVLRPRVVITPSRLTAERIRGLRRDVYVVPFGLRLGEYLRYRTDEKAFDVAIVSRFVPYKGVIEAVKALSFVKRRLRIALVGDGPLRDQVRKEVERSGHLVFFFSSVDEEEKRAILARSLYYLNLSQTEGFSITTLEAVAVGTYPIVLKSEDNAAIEIIETLNYGAAVSSAEEVVEIVERGHVPKPPTAPLKQFDIAEIVDKYEKIIQMFY